MAAFDWIKLGLENWKTIFSIITLVLSLIGSNWYQYREIQDTERKANQSISALVAHQVNYVPRETLAPDNMKALIRQHEKDAH